MSGWRREDRDRGRGEFREGWDRSKRCFDDLIVGLFFHPACRDRRGRKEQKKREPPVTDSGFMTEMSLCYQSGRGSGLTSRVSANDEFSDFVVNKDEETVRKRTKPPGEPEEKQESGWEWIGTDRASKGRTKTKKNKINHCALLSC